MTSAELVKPSTNSESITSSRAAALRRSVAANAQGFPVCVGMLKVVWGW